MDFNLQWIYYLHVFFFNHLTGKKYFVIFILHCCCDQLLYDYYSGESLFLTVPPNQFLRSKAVIPNFTINLSLSMQKISAVSEEFCSFRPLNIFLSNTEWDWIRKHRDGHYTSLMVLPSTWESFAPEGLPVWLGKPAGKGEALVNPWKGTSEGITQLDFPGKVTCLLQASLLSQVFPSESFVNHHVLCKWKGMTNLINGKG